MNARAASGTASNAGPAALVEFTGRQTPTEPNHNAVAAIKNTTGIPVRNELERIRRFILAMLRPRKQLRRSLKVIARDQSLKSTLQDERLQWALSNHNCASCVSRNSSDATLPWSSRCETLYS